MANIPLKSTSQKAIVDVDKCIQLLSKEYGDLKCFKVTAEKEIKRISIKIQVISEKVNGIDEAFEAIQQYSYQYNIKILGIPKVSRNESSEITTQTCMSLFTNIAVKDLSKQDIDIAHRVPNYRRESSRPCTSHYMQI